MKNYIFLMAAASALMLTACSSENDVLQNATQSQQTTAQDQAVGFDVYTPAATNVTRSGQVGTMTTDRLQRTEANGGGFGVYAYLVADATNSAEANSYIPDFRNAPIAPNFMVNEKVLWNPTNQGWYYNPLKYWPNETNNDSQNTNASMESISGNKHLDRLTFFAYAPYVALESTNNTEPGIGLLTKNDGKLQDGSDDVIEASVGYRASLDDPEKVVDLLWGVAPAGGLTYTAVNGNTVKVNEGEPLIDMTKPDVNTTMKFLFQHALARIGINVVAAVDQVGAGGKLDANTKITIDKVTLTGKFGATGVLNLDNPVANLANWVKINTTTNENAITSSTKEINGTTTLTLSADAGTIAPWLRYVGEHTFGSYSAQNDGVTTTKQDLITPRYYALDFVPAYSPSKQYYTEANAKYTVLSTDAYYTESSGNYTKVATDAVIYDDGTSYYKIVEDVTTYSSGDPQPASSDDWDFYTKSGDDYTFAGKGNAVTWGSGSDTYYVLTIKSAVSDIPFVYNNKAVATYTITSSDNYFIDNGPNNYTKINAGTTIDAPNIGSTNTGMCTLDATGTANSAACPDNAATYYTYDDGTKTYTKAGLGSALSWNSDGSTTYYRLDVTSVPSTEIPFAYADGTYYDKERNYFMVVPTNNVANNCTLPADATQEEALRKVRVMIEYYVTTTDSKVEGGYTQTKNVIEKDVLFPSMANGKSYMLNLVLGLTSVKMDAEVDDWKVINVQADLPQNTAE